MPARTSPTRVVRTVAAVLLPVGWLLLAGCGATSEQPLSDDATTAVDARLVGHWTCTSRAWEEEQEEAEAPRDLVVGRRPDLAGGGALEAAWVDLDEDDDQVRVTRVVLLPTRIGESTYLSMRADAEPQGPWFLLRYELTDADSLAIVGLDAEQVASEIASKAVAGRVEGEGTMREVTLSASTEALRVWVEKTPAAFAAGKVARFRRLAVPDRDAR